MILVARPIKETPVLKGKDAARFEKAIKCNESQKVPHDVYQRAIKTYESIKKPG